MGGGGGTTDLVRAEKQIPFWRSHSSTRAKGLGLCRSNTAASLTLVRVRAVGAEGGAHAVHAYPFPLRWAALGCSTAASPQQLQLALEVPLLALQRLQLVLALPVCLFKFLLIRRTMGRQRKGSLCTLVVYRRRQEEAALHRIRFVAPVGAPSNLWRPVDVPLEPPGDFLHPPPCCVIRPRLFTPCAI